MEIFHEVAETCDHPDAETVWKGVRKRTEYHETGYTGI
jgi:hypothetical protein